MFSLHFLILFMFSIVVTLFLSFS